MTKAVERLIVACGLCLVTATFAVTQDQDVEGSKDHPLISRYPGSIITEYVEKEYEELALPLGPAKDNAIAKSQHLEGKWTRIIYDAPQGRSLLEVYRNYEGALQRAGFQILFACANQACGESSEVKLNPAVEDRWAPYDWPNRHLSAKLARSAGDVYVSLHALNVSNNLPEVTLHIIEVKPMEAGLVTVNAAALASDITQTGHAAVYGIYFDTGKAEVKPESDAALEEIAKLLQQDPHLKLYVVGHTDNVGTLANNMDLSKRRADAVVKVLTTKYKVVAARLSAQGDGPTAPVASNDSEDGRAKNRRVELVKQ
jgi:outer membrane protein OmpA-like peptidoglycan-associated protein